MNTIHFSDQCRSRAKWALSKGGSKSKTGGGGAAQTDIDVQGEPQIPSGVSLKENPESRTYEYETPDGNNLKFEVIEDRGIGDVTFEVNGLFSRLAELPDREGIRIANKIKSIMRYDAKQRPDGYIYSTSAFAVDDLGKDRASLYERAGFSKPSYDGDEQYAIVRGGKLYPHTPEWMR